MILVSVIIPVYNVDQYIERCVLSIMNQACKDVKIECILVDDCTPDNSIAIAQKVIDSYVGRTEILFKIVKHEKNQGLSAARNTGMLNATGDYLFFIDSDDYIYDDCIEKLFDVIRKYPDVEVVKGNHSGSIVIDVAKIPSGPIDNDMLLRLLYMGIIPVMAWNTLIKRSLLQKCNVTFMPGLVHEDNLWTFQLFRHVSSFVFVPDMTYYYEENNANSITANNDGVTVRPKAMPHLIIIVDKYLEEFDTKRFVEYALYQHKFIMNMIDAVSKNRNTIDESLRKKVFSERNRLMKIALQHCRLIVVAYELLLFMPFRLLMRLRLFRQRYDFLAKVTYKCAMVFNFMHSQ